jgi:nitroimidazol reductase NimA-like FMN-containing flavoprotein (pyridoxamine 5'-phosphate oxidase superfamily)
MRRKDRQVLNEAEILSIIDACKVFRVAIKDEYGLYIIPLNFGYTFKNGILTMYIHSAKEGRKVDAFRKYSEVAFEMDTEHALITGPLPCNYSYNYSSIIGQGHVEEVLDTEEKIFGLALIMKHQTGKDFEIDDNMTTQISIFKFTSSNYTAKRYK